MPENGVWAVVPAFNEARVIASTIRSVAPEVERIVVVDDGSTDGTADIARAAGVTVLRHAINLGQGAALQTGIEFALAGDARYICTFDADGQHAPETIAIMLDALRSGTAEIALGSRFLGLQSKIPPFRRLLLKAAVLLTRLQTGLNLTDTHNGLRLLTRGAAEKVRITQNRMAHASELLDIIARMKVRYVEVPTTVTYTSYSLAKGQSVLNGVKILLDLLYQRFTG